MDLRSLLLALFVLASPLALPATTASAPILTIAMDAELYSAASTLPGAAPVATVTYLGADGNPAAGVTVRVVFIRQVQLIGFVANQTVLAQTGLDGTVSVAAPLLSGAPGTYLVGVFAVGAVDQDRYTVGA